MIRAMLASALLLATGPVAAQQAQPPQIRQFDVETAERLGRAIYEQDRFAWVGTDALLAAIPQQRLVGGIGWIVVERDDATIVRFGRGTTDNAQPFYDITFQGDAEPVVTEATGAFSDEERAMFRALGLAREGVTEPCSDRYNSVVLPDPDGEGWLVWMLAATTEPDVIPLGGHYRFTISPDGEVVEQKDRLSRDCLILDGPPPEAQRADWLMLNVFQLVSNMPVETFVFTSLAHQIVIAVITPDRRVWQVRGDDIIMVGALPDL